jgi:hypothetical protein
MYVTIEYRDEKNNLIHTQNATKTNIKNLMEKGRSLKKNKRLFGDSEYVIKGIEVVNETIIVHCRKIKALSPYLAEIFGEENYLRKKRG